ncbi:MAG: CBS domain-containing protein [Solirubrobacteraceae bacterium]
MGEAMIERPKACSTSVTVDEVRELFEDDHVHLMLVVDGPALVALIEREDIHEVRHGARPARELGSLVGRTVGPEDDLWSTWQRMRNEGRRRLAVVDSEGQIAGLLCLKQTGYGFCSQAGVDARAAERALRAGCGFGAENEGHCGPRTSCLC